MFFFIGSPPLLVFSLHQQRCFFCSWFCIAFVVSLQPKAYKKWYCLRCVFSPTEFMEKGSMLYFYIRVCNAVGENTIQGRCLVNNIRFVKEDQLTTIVILMNWHFVYFYLFLKSYSFSFFPLAFLFFAVGMFI